MRRGVMGIMTVAGVCLLASAFAAGAPTVGDAEALALAAARAPNTAYTLAPAVLERAIHYSHATDALGFVAPLWRLGVLLAFLATGAAARMRDLAVRTSRHRSIQGYLFTLLLLLVLSLMMLPLGMLGHHLAVEYGQSVQGWDSWFADRAKSSLLELAVGGLLVLLLFAVIRRWPRQWWLTFWAPAVALSVFGVLLEPVLVDPLFNHFEPLAKADPALVSRLEQVVDRAGVNIPPDRMFLMRASDKVTGLNAYVTGIGASKRVVVWDTSLAHASPDEIALIFGHEMGHYALNHIWKGLAFTAVLLLVLFFGGFHLTRWAIGHFGQRWGVPSEGDWAALPVILFALLALAFLSEPLDNAVSRVEEHAADVYGQEAVHGIVADPQMVGQRSFQTLGAQGLDEPHPNPLVVFWSYSHPPIAERAAFAQAYNPWTPGMQPKYFRR